MRRLRVINLFHATGEPTMTAQTTDTVLYRGEDYDLIGLIAAEPITPQGFGMTPAMISTACYRGYFCTYAIEDDRLFLVEMTLRERDGRYLPIGGIQPVADAREATCSYKDLRIPVDYTGSLRLASGFVRECYIHMGYQKASAFETVLDFSLDAGRIVRVHDRSAEAARKRGAFKKHFEENVARGIQESFDLDMDIW